jgi:flagellum-specific ATP synthase
MPDIIDQEHYQRAMRFNEILATYREAEDLINIGAYVKGSNLHIDHSLSKIDQFRGFLKQDMFEKALYDQTLERLNQIIDSPNL